MHQKTRNVNTAFRELVSLFALPGGVMERQGYEETTDGKIAKTTQWKEQIIRTEHSRGGRVLRIAEPLMITYQKPKERVLFNVYRDANPFFHLYESLWMLAGRNDVAPLAHYNSKIGEVASDDGKTFNGAYGYRWRHAHPVSYRDDGMALAPSVFEDVDQLDIIVNHLKADTTSRRAVLQMWNVEDDLLKIGGPNPEYLVDSPKMFTTASKDVCCNLSVMFDLRPAKLEEERMVGPEEATLNIDGYWKRPMALDMMVTNRSNDTIWGALGANVVHFSFLQEYMAARIGVEVGVYHQVSNNMHVYADREDWKPEKLLDYYVSAHVDYGMPKWSQFTSKGDEPSGTYTDTLVPLVRDPAVFEKELPLFVNEFRGPGPDLWRRWDEPFFDAVASPMLGAFALHKAKDQRAAAALANRIKADDWRIAAEQWLSRRRKG